MRGTIVALVVGVPPAMATEMTAGVIMERMELKERYAYVNGIVEGMAYARFRHDTIAAGARDESGMKCIYDWFFTDDDEVYLRIESAFRKYADYAPSVLIAAMIKKECGE